MEKQISKKSAQGIQDEIFKKMSADRKVELGSQLWLLAKELDSDKINYARNYASARPPTSFNRNSKNS